MTIKIKARAARYALINDVLYMWSFSGPYQRCVPPDEAKHIIEQVHEGIYGTHISERSPSHSIMTQGFYWPMMKQESELFVRNYDTYQKFDNIIHAPATSLHSVSSPWPFYNRVLILWAHYLKPLITGNSSWWPLIISQNGRKLRLTRRSG